LLARADRHPRRVGFSELDALMDSLSPGVRAGATLAANGRWQRVRHVSPARHRYRAEAL